MCRVCMRVCVYILYVCMCSIYICKFISFQRSSDVTNSVCVRSKGPNSADRVIFFFKCVPVKCQTSSSTEGHCCTQTNIVGSVAHHKSPLRFYQRSSQHFGRDLPPNQILLTFTLKPTRLQPDEASLFYFFLFFFPTTTPLKYQAAHKNVEICFSALWEFVVQNCRKSKATKFA